MQRKELREKVAYLQGLARGVKADSGSREAEIIVEVLDVMGALVRNADRLRAAQVELSEYVDVIDQDLADLEEGMLEEDMLDGDLADEVTIFEGPEGSVMAEAGQTTIAAEPNPAHDASYVEAECPGCGHPVYFLESYLNEDELEVTCPDCGDVVWDGADDEYEILDEHGNWQPLTVGRMDDPVRESWEE